MQCNAGPSNVCRRAYKGQAAHLWNHLPSSSQSSSLSCKAPTTLFRSNFDHSVTTSIASTCKPPSSNLPTCTSTQSFSPACRPLLPQPLCLPSDPLSNHSEVWAPLSAAQAVLVAVQVLSLASAALSTLASMPQAIFRRPCLPNCRALPLLTLPDLPLARALSPPTLAWLPVPVFLMVVHPPLAPRAPVNLPSLPPPPANQPPARLQLVSRHLRLLRVALLPPTALQAASRHPRLLALDPLPLTAVEAATKASLPLTSWLPFQHQAIRREFDQFRIWLDRLRLTIASRDQQDPHDILSRHLQHTHHQASALR